MTEQERFEQEYQTTILPALEIMEGIETEMPLSEGELMRMVCVSYNNLRQAMDMAQKFQNNTTMDRHYHCHGAFMYWQAKYAAFKGVAMSKDQDRAAEWNRTKGIEAILGPAGGIAVWMRRDEMQSYAVLRGATSFVAGVAELAILQKGMDSLILSLAKFYGVTPEELKKSVIEERMHHTARITSVRP